MEKEKPKYTHIDKDGMRWRFEGSRPISSLADEVMKAVLGQIEQGADEIKEKE